MQCGPGPRHGAQPGSGGQPARTAPQALPQVGGHPRPSSGSATGPGETARRSKTHGKSLVTGPSKVSPTVLRANSAVLGTARPQNPPRNCNWMQGGARGPPCGCTYARPWAPAGCCVPCHRSPRQCSEHYQATESSKKSRPGDDRKPGGNCRVGGIRQRIGSAQSTARLSPPDLGLPAAGHQLGREGAQPVIAPHVPAVLDEHLCTAQQCSTVRSTVQCSAVQCSTVQHSAVQYREPHLAAISPIWQWHRIAARHPTGSATGPG
jgi:hypothetical protein